MSGAWTILHGGALGDLVLALQLALRLPGVAPSGTLRVLSRVNPGDLSDCRPRIVRRSTETLGAHWLHDDGGTSPPPALRDAIAEQAVLNMLGDPASVVHRRLRALRPMSLYSVDPRPAVDSTRHIVEQWQTQLESQGLLVPKCVHQRPGRRVLGVPDALVARGKARLADLGFRKAAAVVHPGSGGRRKCWPLAGFLAVARGLQACGADVLLLLGPAEIETWSDERVAAAANAFPVARCPTPDALVEIVAGCEIFVGNDAGPAHLAGLLGRPMVSVFAPTDPAVWRPLGPACVVVRGDPSRNDWGIEPAEVIEAARSLLPPWARAGFARRGGPA